MSEQCSFSIGVERSGSFQLTDGLASGTQIQRSDVNGDGVPDQLVPATLTVEWSGPVDACQRAAATKLPHDLAANVNQGTGRFSIEVFDLISLSTDGMSGLDGTSWMALRGNSMMSSTDQFYLSIGILNLLDIAYGDALEGETTVTTEQDDAPSITTDEEGRVAVSYGTTTTTTGIRKRSDVDVADIAGSQMRGIFTVPIDGGNLRIGSEIEIKFTGKVPDSITAKYAGSLTGSTLRGTVVNISGIHYRRTDDGRYELMPSMLRLKIVPAGETDILKNIDFPLYTEDSSYTVSIAGARADTPEPAKTERREPDLPTPPAPAKPEPEEEDDEPDGRILF